MNINLIATDGKLADAWGYEFNRIPNVNIIQGSIFNFPSQAIVSPANSFGIMDGGLDGKLRDYFGTQIEKKVRNKIKYEYHGELPVGCAITVETGRSEFPLLISAPTMRVPEDVSTTQNAYLAMRAILIECIRNHIKSIAISGLCSLSGRMDLKIVARQMRVATEKIILGTIGYSHWREEKALQDYMQCKTDYLPEDLEMKYGE